MAGSDELKNILDVAQAFVDAHAIDPHLPREARAISGALALWILDEGRWPAEVIERVLHLIAKEMP